MRDKSIDVLKSFPLDQDTTKWQAREGYLLTLDATFRELLKEHHEKHSKSILASCFLGTNESFRSLLVKTFHRVELATAPTQTIFELRRIGTQLLSSLTVLTCWFDASILFDEIWSKHEPTSFVILDTLREALRLERRLDLKRSRSSTVRVCVCVCIARIPLNLDLNTHRYVTHQI